MPDPNIIASCPDCGDVNLTSPDITLVTDRARKLESFYRFLCPVIEHGMVIVKPAEERIAQLLLDNGVVLQTIDFSEAFDDAAENYQLGERWGPITYDEIANATTLSPEELSRQAEFYPPDVPPRTLTTNPAPGFPSILP